MSLHYIFKPNDLNQTSLKKFLEMIDLFKPKYIGFRLSEEKYKGSLTSQVREDREGEELQRGDEQDRVLHQELGRRPTGSGRWVG